VAAERILAEVACRAVTVFAAVMGAAAEKAAWDLGDAKHAWQWRSDVASALVADATAKRMAREVATAWAPVPLSQRAVLTLCPMLTFMDAAPRDSKK